MSICTSPISATATATILLLGAGIACGVDAADPLIRPSRAGETGTTTFPVNLVLRAGWEVVEGFSLDAPGVIRTTVPAYGESGDLQSADVVLSVGRFYGFFGRSRYCHADESVTAVTDIDTERMLSRCTWDGGTIALSGEADGIVEVNRAVLFRDATHQHIAPARIIAEGWDEGAYVELELGAPQPFTTGEEP